MPITKSELINDTAISCGMARDNAKNVVEQFFQVVQDLIKEGKSIEIRGFGTFSPKTCNSRVGRNLQTGELISLAPHKSMSFKFSPELKAQIGKLPVDSRKSVSLQEQVGLGKMPATDKTPAG